jgi:hypothetical protein
LKIFIIRFCIEDRGKETPQYLIIHIHVFLSDRVLLFSFSETENTEHFSVRRTYVEGKGSGVRPVRPHKHKLMLSPPARQQRVATCNFIPPLPFPAAEQQRTRAPAPAPPRAMDAVAFPPPPAPFLDDDFDFGDFTFASAPAPTPAAPHPPTFAALDDDWGDFVASPLGSNADASAPPTAPTAATSDAAPSSWEKPRGPLPLSLFGAGDGQDEEEEEGSAGPPTATAPQRAAGGSGPADLKDLIAGLYGSQPPPTAGAADAGPQEEAEDGGGIGDDDWEFTAATAEPADQDRGGRAPGDGIGKIEVSVAFCDDAFLPPVTYLAFVAKLP